MNDKADFAPIRWSYKKTREIARRMDAFRGELTSHHPPLPPCVRRRRARHRHQNREGVAPERLHRRHPHGHLAPVSAARVSTIVPLLMQMRVCSPGEPYNADLVHDDIKYTKEDDEAIDNWIADHVETTWHSLGERATAGQ